MISMFTVFMPLRRTEQAQVKNRALMGTAFLIDILLFFVPSREDGSVQESLPFVEGRRRKVEQNGGSTEETETEFLPPQSVVVS